MKGDNGTLVLSCLFAVGFDLIFCNDTTNVTSSIWGTMTQRVVTSYVTATSGISNTHCVQNCREVEGCTSVAFDPVSEVCYLQPVHHLAVSSPEKVNVYFLEKECQMEEVPNISHAYINWGSSSREGHVICDTDFMYSGSIFPRVQCAENGAWEVVMDGQCKQYVWRNISMLDAATQFVLPKTAGIGWKVCLTGTPTASSAIEVNLETVKQALTLHISGRLNYHNFINVTILTSYNGFNYGPHLYLYHPDPIFPFVEGRPFNMSIVAASLYDYEVYVDNSLYGSVTSIFPVTDVYRLHYKKQVQLHFVDVWC